MTLEEARKMAQQMIEAREGAESGEWEFVDAEGNQFVICVKQKSKRGPEHDKIKQICALPGFSAKTKEFKFIAHAANTAKPLAEFTLRAIAALEKAKEIASKYMDRDEFTPQSECKADLESIQAILEGKEKP